MIVAVFEIVRGEISLFLHNLAGLSILKCLIYIQFLIQQSGTQKSKIHFIQALPLVSAIPFP
jgi:hypothetical protein